MAGSQTGSNLLASITGNVNKAYILLPCPRAVWNNTIKRTNVRDLFENSQTRELKNAAAALLQNTTADSNINLAGGLMGADNTSFFGVSNSLVTKAQAQGFVPIQVQYNPSSIVMESEAGRDTKEHNGFLEQVNTPEETVLKMELIFDDMNLKDAFMWDVLSVSTGAVLQTGKQLANAAAGKYYSVQNKAEIFVGAITKPQSRVAGLIWNDMILFGEMVAVSVEYTMFNKQGDPVRAKVGIQIRQDEPTAGGDLAAAIKQYWEEAYKKLFISNYQGGARSVRNAAQNLINW